MASAATETIAAVGKSPGRNRCVAKKELTRIATGL
jgi:hypothetical protein